MQLLKFSLSQLYLIVIIIIAIILFIDRCMNVYLSSELCRVLGEVQRAGEADTLSMPTSLSQSVSVYCVHAVYGVA